MVEDVAVTPLGGLAKSQQTRCHRLHRFRAGFGLGGEYQKVQATATHTMPSEVFFIQWGITGFARYEPLEEVLPGIRTSVPATGAFKLK